MKRGRLGRAILVLTAILGVAAAALLWIALAPRRVPAGQPPLVTLDPDSLASFRDAFNASPGEVRVLALLSPT